MLPRNKLLQERYRIIGTLGRGGMGHVYEAIDESVSAQVAIKENLADTEEKRKSFAQEAKLLANLQHEALPRVMHQFVEEGRQFLVMEYIRGDNLVELLEKYQRLSPHQPAFHYEVVLNWADVLLDALEYLHSRPEPIIHRDIKPSNIKLTSDGKIYLLDFGLAKGAAGQMTTIKEAEGAQSVFGYSMYYAPLEQLSNSGTDARSDLYALGATLHHLLTGHPPCSAADRHKALDEGDADPLIPIHKINEAVPEAVSLVIEQAMALSRKDRFATARAMRNALHEARQLAKAHNNIQPVFGTTGPISEPALTTDLPAHIMPGPTLASPTQEANAAPEDAQPGPSPVTNSVNQPTIFAEVPDLAVPESWPVATEPPAANRSQELFDEEQASPPPSPPLQEAGEALADTSSESTVDAVEDEEATLPSEGEIAGALKAGQADGWREKVERQKREMQEVARAQRERSMQPLRAGSMTAGQSEPARQTRRPLIILAIFALLIICVVIGGTAVFINYILKKPSVIDANNTASPTPGGSQSQANAGPVPTPDNNNKKTLTPAVFPYDSTPRTRQLLGRQKETVWRVTLSPDSNLIATAGADHQVRVWDARSRALQHNLTGHQADIYAVAFSPDGKTLASASKDATVKLWDVQSGELKVSLSDNSDEVYSVAFSPDGKMLASASKDATVRLWRLGQSSLEPQRLKGHSGKVFALAFSTDGKILASGSEDTTIRLWDVQNDKELRPALSGSKGVIFSVAFSNNGRFLVSGGVDGEVQVWDTSDWGEKNSLGGLPEKVWITALAFSPDDRALACGSTNGAVRLWEMSTWQLKTTLAEHNQSVTYVSFAPDGKQLFGGSQDGRVWLWQW
jgi:WD40 repeat protein/serine/threonine protein kinase